MSKDRKTDEQDTLTGEPSPRTTIVGGRPPEGTPSRFPVPTGIQKLLHLAAASPEFLRLLIERRSRVAEAAGVALTGSEVAVLGAISDGQLATMAGAVPRSSLGPSSRQVAAAAVVLLGGAGVAACELPEFIQDRVSRVEMATDGGAAPDEPPPRDTAMPAPTGIQPDIPPDPAEPEPDGEDEDAPPAIPELEEPAVEEVPEQARPTRGIRPDIPPIREEVRPMETAGGAEPSEPPERPEMILPTAGIPPQVEPFLPPPEPEPEVLPDDEEWKTRAGMSTTVPDPSPPPPPEDEAAVDGEE